MPTDKQQQAMYVAMLRQEMDSADTAILTTDIIALVMERAGQDAHNLAAAILEVQGTQA